MSDSHKLFAMALALLLAVLVAVPTMAQNDPVPGATDDPANGLTQNSPLPGADDSDLAQQQAARLEQISDALLNELDNMVPGDFADDSPQRKALEKVVAAFMDGQAQVVNDTLDELAAEDSDFPPRDLMLAAMSYILRDQRSGRALLERAAVNSPDYPGTYAAFSRLALNEGRITDALALLEKCAKAVREKKGELSDKARDHFGRQYSDGMIEVAAAQGRFDDARKMLDYQFGKTPDDPKTLMTAAEVEFKAGELDKSQSYLEKLKSKVPETRPYESIFANWFLRTGKGPEAAKWIHAAAEQHPRDDLIQLDYAKLLIAEEKFDVCGEVIGKIEQLSGESVATKILRGQIEFAKQKYGEAAKIFEDVANEQPGSIEVANLYAMSLIEAGGESNLEQAMKVASENFRRASNNMLVAATLGYAQLATGDVEASARLLSQIARSRQVTAEIAYIFAKLSVARGEIEQARSVLKSALGEQRLFLYRESAKELLSSLYDKKEEIPEP